MLKNYEKPALTFEQQLEKLKHRGLIISNYDEALLQLQTISYYRLSAYWYPFRIRDSQGKILDKFLDNTTFDDVVSLYEFDCELRLIIMNAFEHIEVHIRTLLTYYFGHKYGAFAFYKC